MIINVRGTNGSGKSTLVSSVMRERRMTPLLPLNRGTLPVGYVDPRLFIAGHYEHAMGGIDTFRTTLSDAFKVLRRWAATHDVLFEGKSINDDVEHVLALRRASIVVVVLLDEPVEVCYESMRKRERANRITREHVERLHRKAHRDAGRFEAAGVAVHRLTRADAGEFVRSLLISKEAVT